MAQYSAQSANYLPTGGKLFEVVMLSDKDGNIINSSGAASNIPIAAGAVVGYDHINKFGATPGNITAGTVWDGNTGTVTYPYPAAGVITVTSTAGTGDLVHIEGLDANYLPQTEDVAIGGTGTLTFLRIFRAYMDFDIAAEDVVINQGGAIAAKIIEGENQTLMAVYTIPAGKTGYLLKLTAGSAKASTNSAMKYSLLVKEFQDGGVFRSKGVFYAAGGQNMTMEYPIPITLLEKSDIRIDATAAQQTEVNATFCIVLVDNV